MAVTLTSLIRYAFTGQVDPLSCESGHIHGCSVKAKQIAYVVVPQAGQSLIHTDHRHPTGYGRQPELCRICIHPFRRLAIRLASCLGLVRWLVAGRIRLDWIWHGGIALRRGQRAAKECTKSNG